MHSNPPLRVFIAEDSRLFQHALLSCMTLVPNVVVVGQAFTGEEAVAGIRRTNPDLVLLDIMMPKGDGFSVLRSIPPGENSPLFVVLTFFVQESVRKACRQLGVHHVYDKADAFHPLMELLNSLSSGKTTARLSKTPSDKQLVELCDQD